MKDYYRALGVAETATEGEIKKAYRKLAKQFHPDTNDSQEAHDRFVAIAEAYSVLSDQDQRDLYDRRRSGRASNDALQRMADAFAKAQEVARAQAEAEYQRQKAWAEAKEEEERKWGVFTRITARIGIVLTMILLLDFFGATWTDPATIVHKTMVRNGRFYRIETAKKVYMARSDQARFVMSGWQIREKTTPILGQRMDLEAFPAGSSPGNPWLRRHLSTGANLYKPFFFFPLLMVLFTIGTLFRKQYMRPVQGLQFAIGVWTFLGLSLLALFALSLFRL